ncbi:MAG: DUF1178 family protein [Roseomonas sp.]|nr:DUF1178 family protein [Roseomonas sp.]MCA3282187.1 DUF1178 family protein [Roseomonas sp.]MCA3298105.1 DUF1178 family protein [Roseomonas sp.]
MIRYELRCDQAHEFDGWFKDSAAFDKLAAAGLVECPHCGPAKVAKRLMAPAIPKKGRPARNAKPEALPAPVAETPSPPPAPAPPPAPPPPALPAAALAAMPAELRAMLRHMRTEIEKNCDYVGSDFAEEARKIHHGEVEARGIFGEATEDEAEALREEGIEIARIPWVPPSDA